MKKELAVRLMISIMLLAAFVASTIPVSLYVGEPWSLVYALLGGVVVGSGIWELVWFPYFDRKYWEKR